jgi:hypothetical protein
MEEIIGLLVVLAVGIFKAVNKKFEEAGTQPDEIFEPMPDTHVQVPPVQQEPISVPKPVEVRPEPVKPVVVPPRPVAPKPKPSTIEVVDRQIVSRKPMLVEDEEKDPKEKIDPKKLVLYSEIMTPKFNE